MAQFNDNSTLNFCNILQYERHILSFKHHHTMRLVLTALHSPDSADFKDLPYFTQQVNGRCINQAFIQAVGLNPGCTLESHGGGWRSTGPMLCQLN